jgi:hypothetical protein
MAYNKNVYMKDKINAIKVNFFLFRKLLFELNVMLVA